MQQKELRLAELARYEIRALRTLLSESPFDNLKNLESKATVNVYGMINGHHNSDRTISMIKLCSPFLYPATSLDTLDISVETWKKNKLTLDFGPNPKDKVRMFWSSLETMLLRASIQEIKGIYDFLGFNTAKLIDFNVLNWEFRGLGNQNLTEKLF